MADKIDKSLTQSPRGSVELPSEEDIQETVVEAQEEISEAPGPVEVNEQEDGSVEIDCNSPSSCRSGYSVSSVSLQRIITSRWTS